MSFGINDLVFIRPSAVDPYFQLQKPRGKVLREFAPGKYKVEIFDTYSQDTEGHNCYGKFVAHDLSFVAYPEAPPRAPESKGLEMMTEEFARSRQPSFDPSAFENTPFFRQKMDRYLEAKFQYHAGALWGLSQGREAGLLWRQDELDVNKRLYDNLKYDYEFERTTRHNRDSEVRELKAQLSAQAEKIGQQERALKGMRKALGYIAKTDISALPPDFLWLQEWRNNTKSMAQSALKEWSDEPGEGK